MTKPKIDTDALGELFEAIRGLAAALPDDPENPHHRTLLQLIADRGDALCGNT